MAGNKGRTRLITARVQGDQVRIKLLDQLHRGEADYRASTLARQHPGLLFAAMNERDQKRQARGLAIANQSLDAPGATLHRSSHPDAHDDAAR